SLSRAERLVRAGLQPVERAEGEPARAPLSARSSPRRRHRLPLTRVAPLAVSLGDPAGIGPEITAKAWEQRTERNIPAFFAVGDEAAIAKVWNGPLAVIAEPAEACKVFGHALPVIRVDGDRGTEPGRP